VQNEETLCNFRVSLDTLEQLVHAQAEQIRQLEHERDLLAVAFGSMLSRRADPPSASASRPVKDSTKS
jgi:hypothetical protein